MKYPEYPTDLKLPDSDFTGWYANFKIRPGEHDDIDELASDIAKHAGFEHFQHNVINRTVNNLGLPDLMLVVRETKPPA